MTSWAGPPGRRWRGAALVGLVLFAVAWFLPVHEVLDGLTKMQRETGPSPPGAEYHLVDGPPGWVAFRFNWDELWKAETWRGAKEDPRALVWHLTCLTNLYVLAAAGAIAAGARARTMRGMGWALLVCFAVNASWFWLPPSPKWQIPEPGASIRSGLRVGYWLWLASFGVVGASLIAGRDRETSGI